MDMLTGCEGRRGVRRHMCMDVMVSMDVMTTVLLLHDRLLNMLLLMCGCMYFGVMINMDLVVAVLPVSSWHLGSLFVHDWAWDLNELFHILMSNPFLLDDFGDVNKFVEQVVALR